MQKDCSSQSFLEPEARQFYCQAMDVLERAGVRYLVGGAYAFGRYTGIERHTKDFDIFVHPDEFQAALDALASVGYLTDVPFPHWLGKAYFGEYFVDLIFSSGNGVARVDDDWFTYAAAGEVLGHPVKLIPAEEMIWSKSFVQERERFDGADIQHILRARAEQLDWQRLLQRFDGYWRVLMAHMVMFGFVYPSERCRIPSWAMRELMGRLDSSLEPPAPADPVCHGPLISRQQYLIDLDRWGYEDVRRRPENPMTDAQIALWTDGIAVDGTH